MTSGGSAAGCAVQLLSELPADAVDTLVGIAGAGSGSPLLSVEVRHLGGALANALV